MNGLNLIAWFTLILERLGNMCIVMTYCRNFDVRNVENYLIFIFSLFSFMTNKVRKKIEYLQNEMSFQEKIKRIFHSFSKTNCFAYLTLMPLAE